MKVNCILLVLTIVVCSSLGAKLPSNFKICHRDDPKIGECLKDAIQISLTNLENGIPELKIAKLKPLHVPSASIGEGKGPVNVKQDFRDLLVYGLSASIVQKAKTVFDDDTFKIDIDVIVPELKFQADYSLNGRILLLPIVGNGKCTVTADNVDVTIHMSGGRFQKKGEDYLKATKCEATLTPKKVAFNFENLFNGDETLGKQTNNVLNDNWEEIFKDVKEGYEEVVGAVIGNYANSVFQKIPLNELFPK